jgi:hypothetical protein
MMKKYISSTDLTPAKKSEVRQYIRIAEKIDELYAVIKALEEDKAPFVTKVTKFMQKKGIDGIEFPDATVYLQRQVNGTPSFKMVFEKVSEVLSGTALEILSRTYENLQRKRKGKVTVRVNLKREKR